MKGPMPKKGGGKVRDSGVNRFAALMALEETVLFAGGQKN